MPRRGEIWRLLAAGVACALAMPVQAVTAAADDGVVVVGATAGYVATTAAPQPAPAQGDLAVAHSALGEQARAVMALELPADVADLTVTFRASGQPAAAYGSPAVSACRVTSAWTPGPAQPLSTAPSVDCTGAAPVLAAPWTFDLSHIVRAWHDGAPVLGIALVDITSATPAQVTFNIIGTEHVGTFTRTPQAPGPTRQPEPVPTPAPQPAPQPAGGDGGSSYPALGSVQVPPPIVPSLAVAPSPVALGPTTAQRAALASPLDPLRVEPLVWLLLPLGVWAFLLLVRAVSSGADELSPVVTA
jgi:hypothetical protein